MAVAVNPQQRLDGEVIDDPDLVKAATELERLEHEQTRRAKRATELRETLIRGVEGRYERDVTLHIGPITIKQRWQETEEKEVEFVRKAKQGWAFHFKFPKREEQPRQRRSRQDRLAERVEQEEERAEESTAQQIGSST